MEKESNGGAKRDRTSTSAQQIHSLSAHHRPHHASTNTTSLRRSFSRAQRRPNGSCSHGPCFRHRPGHPKQSRTTARCLFTTVNFPRPLPPTTLAHDTILNRATKLADTAFFATFVDIDRQDGRQSGPRGDHLARYEIPDSGSYTFTLRSMFAAHAQRQMARE